MRGSDIVAPNTNKRAGKGRTRSSEYHSLATGDDKEDVSGGRGPKEGGNDRWRQVDK